MNYNNLKNKIRYGAFVLAVMLPMSGCALKIADTEDATTGTDGSTGSGGTNSGMNLEVPIELCDYGLANETASEIIFDRTRTSLSTADYDGTVTYFFEIVTPNDDNNQRTVSLIDASGTVQASIDVPASATSVTRYRTSFTPNPGADNYRVAIGGTPNVGWTPYVSSCRIIVRQENATKTKLYFPLASSNFTHSNTLSALSTTTSTTYVNADGVAFWKKDSTALADLITSNPWSLEAVLSTSDGAHVAYASLLNMTSPGIVTDSEVSSASTTPELVTVVFSDTAAEFTDDNDFRIQIRSGDASATARLHKVGLWVTLENLSKTQSVYRISKAWDSTFQIGINERVLIETSRFSSPSIYHEVTAYNTGDWVLSVFDTGANDSGTTGVDIADSDPAPAAVTHRARTGQISLTDGHQYILNWTSGSSGEYGISSSFLIINAVK